MNQILAPVFFAPDFSATIFAQVLWTNGQCAIYVFLDIYGWYSNNCLHFLKCSVQLDNLSADAPIKPEIVPSVVSL